MTETNFYVDQGSDFKRSITIKDSSGETIDLSGRVFLGAAKKDYRSSSISFHLTLTLLDQTLFPGQLDFTIAAEYTRKLKVFEAVPFIYDIKQVLPGEESILLFGKIYVVPRVTK